MSFRIPFNRFFISGSEVEHVANCMASGQTAGDGPYTKQCERLLKERFGAGQVLLTTSGTSALEMAAMLSDVRPGDEVILPSYTFVSTANAFLLRGAKLRFVDIRPDTMNLDERLLPAAIRERTRVICPVHYAGVACEMEPINTLARKHDIVVVEDAAQGVNSTYQGAYLGTLGQLGAYSFHATKNFSCGEGGALVIRDDEFIERAEIIREKGTNRSRFFRGQVDKYTWVDVGSSYVPSDILAAALFGQLQHIEEITAQRKRVYDSYFAALEPLAKEGLVTLPTIPASCGPNYHMFYLLLGSLELRTALIGRLREAGVLAVFHYVPLHTSPMGSSLGYVEGMLPVTESISDRLLRLPIYPSLTADEIGVVVHAIYSFFRVPPPTQLLAEAQSAQAAP